MAKQLRILIKEQDVAFDTHQAGDGQSVNWEKLHLEKRLHKGGKARFPLFGNEKPSSSGMNEDDFSRVKKEVRKALENQKIFEALAKRIVDELDRFRNGNATHENAREAAQKIAGYFDLDKNFLRIVEEYADNKLLSFTTIHFNPNELTLHEIHQSGKEIAIQKPRIHNSLKRIYPHNV